MITLGWLQNSPIRYPHTFNSRVWDYRDTFPATQGENLFQVQEVGFANPYLLPF